MTSTMAVTQNAGDLAERILGNTLTLDDLVSIADGSLEAQAVFTRVRVLAERQIAQQFLFNADELQVRDAESALRKHGWTKHRIDIAKRYTQLTLIAIDEYTQNTISSQRESSTTQIRSLAPVVEHPERKTLTAAYTSPPIDVQLAREFGLEASDERAEFITTSVNKALQGMTNPRHAYVWAKYHGIQENGTMGDRWTFQGIAANMDTTRAVTREYIESLYYRASCQVFQQLATDALNALANPR